MNQPANEIQARGPANEEEANWFKGWFSVLPDLSRAS